MGENLILIVVFASISAVAFAHGDGQSKASARQSMVEADFRRTGDPRKVTRTINVDRADTMRFTPAELMVNQGDTVKFVVRNSDRQMHEMVLGSIQELKKRAELMRKHPGMEHYEPYMAHVPPGRTTEIVWQFTKAGEFPYGCLIPGHLEAGIVGRIKVVAK